MQHPDTIFLAPANIHNKKVAEELGVKLIGKYSGHKWEQIDLPAHLKTIGSPLLFNPANTAPLFYTNSFLTLHDLAFHHHPEWNSKLFSLWYNFLVPKIVRKAKHLFTVSNTVKNEILTNYKIEPGKISLTYNGISQEMITGEHTHVKKEKIILSVGSFNIRKNHHNLIAGFLKSNIKKEFKLIIVGDRNKVFKNSPFDESIFLNNNIEIRAQFSDTELIAMYKSAAILVSLSVYEGFGIPLLEGLFHNCKILCSDIPVYRELYEGSAQFCNPYDIDVIAMALDNCAVSEQPIDVKIAELLQKYNYANAAKEIINQMTMLQL